MGDLSPQRGKVTQACLLKTLGTCKHINTMKKKFALFLLLSFREPDQNNCREHMYIAGIGEKGFLSLMCASMCNSGI